MAFAYFALGLLAVFALHRGLGFLAKAEPAHIRRMAHYLFFALLAGTVLLLLRLGLVYHAEILAFLGIAIPLTQRLMVMRMLYRQGRQPRHQPPPATQAMTAAEAREILGVDEDATPKEIKVAHHRMIQKNHPDQGGSTYLASQINRARDVLLAGKK